MGIDTGTLDEAYERFRSTGPEWGEDQLTNHGPMAVEVLVRRGHADQVPAWVDSYVRRLDELPRPTARITALDWAEALGDGRRIGDWTRLFTDEIAERPWRDVLALWWPRLLPHIAAGTTHGVIRTGHAVRTLLSGDEHPAALPELAHGLAFWAARARRVPHAGTALSGQLDAAGALAAVPRVPRQQGTVADRLGQLESMDAWPASVAALRAPADPDEARARLIDLVDAATLNYLPTGHASPVLLVHTATAPNAVLHCLPALPRQQWAPSVAAAWGATAALLAAYAPDRPLHGEAPASAPPEPGVVEMMTDRAVNHGDEHVIKFTDTAAEVYQRTGAPDALAAAIHCARLIPQRS